MKGWARRLLDAIPTLIAGLILVTMVLLVPAFGQSRFWLTLSREYFATAALALALMPIIVTGGIDLSVGSATALAAVVGGVLWRDLGWPIGAALLGGAATGLAAGLVNGTLITLGTWPLVATLATRELYRGLALTLTGDDPVTRFPEGPQDWWREQPLGLPPPLWGLLGLAVLTYLVVHHTWMGRALYALGDNERAARFAGVPVRGLKLGLYAWSGLMAGLCGVALVLTYGAAKPDAAPSLELWAIACVVLGGVRVTGGAGNVFGTALGIVSMVALLAGLRSAAPDWRDTITGALLIAVAVTNEAVARLSARRRA